MENFKRFYYGEKRDIVMKSIMFMSLFIFTFCFCSCSTDIENGDRMPDAAIVNSNYELISKLQSFNDSLKSDATKGRMRKIRWWTTKQRINVMLADFAGIDLGYKAGAVIGAVLTEGRGTSAGALVGGVVCGVLASWAASPEYVASKEEEIYDEIVTAAYNYFDEDLNIKEDNISYNDNACKSMVLLDDSIVSDIRLPGDIQKIGLLHNVLLATIEGSVSCKEAKKAIKNSPNGTIEIGTIESIMQMVRSKEFREKCRYYQDRLNSDNDDISKEEQTILLFEDACNSYVNEITDVVFIVNKYKEIIDLSEELSKEEKNCIYAALATAVYSFNYWSNNTEL